jgi:hypothetical protein
VQATVVRQGGTTDCAARLKQCGMALALYADEYHNRFPAAAPPLGFGDLHNWGDLWAQTDVPSGWFFSDEDLGGGLRRGNKTTEPRLPRLLEAYAGDVMTLHCPERGPTQYWPEVGPYYYHTTCPWGTTTLPSGEQVTDYGLWECRARPTQTGGRVAVAACQDPLWGPKRNFAWRHGKRVAADPDGLNNHLYPSGAVRTLTNPDAWERDDP